MNISTILNPENSVKPNLNEFQTFQAPIKSNEVNSKPNQGAAPSKLRLPPLRETFNLLPLTQAPQPHKHILPNSPKLQEWIISASKIAPPSLPTVFSVFAPAVQMTKNPNKRPLSNTISNPQQLSTANMDHPQHQNKRRKTNPSNKEPSTLNETILIAGNIILSGHSSKTFRCCKTGKSEEFQSRKKWTIQEKIFFLEELRKHLQKNYEKKHVNISKLTKKINSHIRKNEPNVLEKSALAVYNAYNFWRNKLPNSFYQMLPLKIVFHPQMTEFYEDANFSTSESLPNWQLKKFVEMKNSNSHLS